MAERLTESQRLTLEALLLDTERTRQDWHSVQHYVGASVKALATRGLVDVLEKRGQTRTHRLCRLTKAGREALAQEG